MIKIVFVWIVVRTYMWPCDWLVKCPGLKRPPQPQKGMQYVMDWFSRDIKYSNYFFNVFVHFTFFSSSHTFIILYYFLNYFPPRAWAQELFQKTAFTDCENKNHQFYFEKLQPFL